MDILITGSVAYDYLMTFPGLFKEQILPERSGFHQLVVSGRFDVEATRRHRAEYRVYDGFAWREAARDGNGWRRFFGLSRLAGFKRRGYFADESDSRKIHRFVLCDDRSGFRSNCFVLSRERWDTQQRNRSKS